MTKIEKILVFLEKNNEITNVNSQTIKLFENLVVESDFEDTEFKNKLKKIYIWFNDKYDFEIEDYEYNLNSEKIVSIVKTNSNLTYNKKLQIVMELKDKNLEEEELKRKIFEYINGSNNNSNNLNQNSNNGNQSVYNPNMINTNQNLNNGNQSVYNPNMINTNQNLNYGNQSVYNPNMINTNQNLNNGNQNVYNSNVISNESIKYEQNSLKILKNLIVSQTFVTIIALLSILFLIIALFSSTSSYYSSSSAGFAAAFAFLWVVLGTIINITSTVLGIIILVKQSQITRIKFNKSLVITSGILSILMFISTWTLAMISIGNLIILIISWTDLNKIIEDSKI